MLRLNGYEIWGMRLSVIEGREEENKVIKQLEDIEI